LDADDGDNFVVAAERKFEPPHQNTHKKESGAAGQPPAAAA
jgi:hypothetical protein